MTGLLHVGIGVLCGPTGGPATYGRRLVEALADLGQVRLSVLTDRPDEFEVDTVDVPMHGGIDRLRWQHVALPRALRKLACDVYHDTKNALPRRLDVPAVVTVHDLAYRRMPETFGAMSRWFLARATADAVRRAARVIVPSEATAADIAAFFPDDAHKTRVVLHGIDPHRRCTAAELDSARERLRLPERFVLHVGTIQARKNVDLLVRAVRRLRASGLEHRCVLAGRRGWRAAAAFAEIERDDTALYLGEVSDDDLRALYELADAFVSPSSYEGFGFTVADALAAGTPTVISDVSSLPEVCGTAAERIPTLDSAGIAGALCRVVDDLRRIAELRAAGPERAREFSWRRAAEQTLAVYREAVAAHQSGPAT